MTRATQLSVTERSLLEDWARQLPFEDEAYLVGSVLNQPDYRDVDVRLIVDDERFDLLASLIDVARLGFMVSLWGQMTTKLPIDFQVQRQSEANCNFRGPRLAVGLSLGRLMVAALTRE